MSVTVSPEPPDSAEARVLVAELEAELEPLYPPESRYGYSVDQLVERQVSFFVCRDEDGVAAGCGGIELNADYAELKRVFVRPPFRGRGLARTIVEHLIGHAAACGAPLVRLETGVHQHAAIALYRAMGFEPTGRFGDYPENPLSVFLERAP